VAVVRIGAEDGDREQDRGEGDHEQGDAVDPDLPADPQGLDPGVGLGELEGGGAGLERGEQPDGDAGGGEAEQQGHGPDDLDPAATDEADHGGADGRQGDERGEHREAGGVGLGGQDARHGHQMPLARTRATSSTAPKATTSA
jgi:hypothetical protein